MDPVAEQLHKERQERLANAPSRRERATGVVAALLLVVACGLIAYIDPPTTPDFALVAGLIVTYAIFWQIDFEIGSASTTPLQIAFVPMWFALSPALLPLGAVVAQVLGGLIAAGIARRPSALRRAFVTGTFAWHAVGPALVLALFHQDKLDLNAMPILMLALAAQFAFDSLSHQLRMAAAGHSQTPLAPSIWMWTIDAALTPIGLFTALAVAVSPWAILGVLPLGAVLAQFAKERDERILHAIELSGAYRGTAQLMGDVLEADDAYTGGEHTKGVVGLALALGSTLGLDPRQMRDLEFGALLHDIGKLRVPNEIINKPGKLNDEEWAIIKQHPGYGQEMLDRVGGELSRAGVIVRAHHERWDGGGYPDGLRGEEIPVEARIITICDSFSAMTTDRSYRKGMSHAEALTELLRCSGSQFDPSIVEALFDALGEPHLRPVVSEVEPVRITAPVETPRAA